MNTNFNSISEIYKQFSNYNTHTVSVGFKHVDNQPTEDLSIIHFVNKKLPIDQIPEDEIIPKEIILDGKTYKTDVIQMQPMSAFACFDYDNAQPPLEVMSNRSRHRPIVGGTIIGNVLTWSQPSSGSYNISFGTLGLIAYDNTDNTLVGLTNAHVMCENYLYSSETTSPTAYNIIDPKFYNNTPDYTLNGLLSSNISQFTINYVNSAASLGFKLYDDCIGRPKRYQPIHVSIGNPIDAALIQLKPDVVDITSTSQNGLPSTQGLEFATTNEILNSYNYQVLSSGARTGPKGETCPMYIVAIDAYSTVSYRIGSIIYNIPVTDAIVYGYPGLPADHPSDGGDSGSALLLKTNNGYKIMGLVYGGNGTIGLACRIDHIADTLNISAYTNQTPLSTVNDPQYIIKPKDQTETTIQYNGKTYWQSGTRLTGEQPI
jgi:hypothetical protein